MARPVIIAALSAMWVLCCFHDSFAEGITYRKGVIDGDTTWEGTVTITGQTVVKKGATLTILPGTVVAFAWTDEDDNGIGDGELNIEGRLLARGTREKMITFTSAGSDPRMKDWTYVMLSLNRDSRIEHCLFEHAFTGLQAHLSSAVIRNNVFRGNFEGLRFSTADLLIERNDFMENSYGIRYESRGSDATITANVFTGNEYAFFPVLRCDSKVKIKGNNITSRSYNVKLGQNQRADLDFRDNWWGTASPAAIEAGLFDRRRDNTLGRVIYEPFRTSPVMESGRQ